MDVEAGQVVATRSCLQGDEVCLVKRPKTTKVEDRSEVREERIITRAGKHLCGVVEQRGNGCVAERPVVGHRTRSDVGWCHNRVGRDGGRSPALHFGDGVGLADVEVGVVQRCDLVSVVQERVWVRVRGLEPELVLDVGHGIAVVVDVELVEHIVTELMKIRSACWKFERVDVHDQRGARSVVGAHERVDVG